MALDMMGNPYETDTVSPVGDRRGIPGKHWNSAPIGRHTPLRDPFAIGAERNSGTLWSSGS